MFSMIIKFLTAFFSLLSLVPTSILSRPTPGEHFAYAFVKDIFVNYQCEAEDHLNYSISSIEISLFSRFCRGVWPRGCYHSIGIIVSIATITICLKTFWKLHGFVGKI